jgi:hypothetical protein
MINTWAVLGIALLMGIVYLRAAVRHVAFCENMVGGNDRIERAAAARERPALWARYTVACISFGTAAALLSHAVSAAGAYGVLCLSLVGVHAADLVAEERALRRRTALLGRSRRIDPILRVWIAVAVASSALLVPYLLGPSNRVAAAVVAVCVLAMAFIAWRIAAAPPLLLGDDLDAEAAADRVLRVTRTGLTCTIAVGSVFVFSSFIGGSFARDWGISISFFTTFALWASEAVYARRLSRAALAP